jgi:hypothetical protein
MVQKQRQWPDLQAHVPGEIDVVDAGLAQKMPRGLTDVGRRDHKIG